MILLVPIHLDALSLAADQSVLDVKADFTRLPYTDGTRDVNGDVAYISEEILSEPFEEQNLYLKAGLHLHWALPDALTKGIQAANETNFPEVPNRWLVVRRHRDDPAKVVEKRWIIESDYLYPFGKVDASASVSYPIMPVPASGCPFRFLGRSQPLENWKPFDAKAEYLNSLTAVGYGEPTFAAFYPNCRSVFGFHDEDYTNKIPDGLQYDVFGWYSDPEKDCLSKFLRSPANDSKSNEELLKLIEKEFKWTTALESGQEFPAQMLCYARLTFKPDTDLKANIAAVSTAEITVANTGTEALSAYLANVLAASNTDANLPANQLKSQIEDQLEALSFTSRLNNRQLDIGAKFQEARHEKGFSAVSGGTIWSITPRSSVSASADAAQSSRQAQITLPEEMAHQLNDANRLQQSFDRASEDIESLRRQLFFDWYKYLLCAYPPDDSRDDYPNIDEVKHFIEVNGLAPLQKKIAVTGDLNLEFDDDGNLTNALSDSSSSDSTAFQLATALKKLSGNVALFNKTGDLKKANVAYRLNPTSAPRYYQPNEPVVLLTGDIVKPSPRHGQDGRLRADDLLECQLLPDAEIKKLIPGNLPALKNAIDVLANSDDDNLAFTEWNEQPWNLFLMEWEAEVFPVENRSNLEPLTAAYQPDFINSNFLLKEDDVDFSVSAGKGVVAKAANVYSGSSILTPHAGIQLKARIEDYLKEELLEDYYAAKQIPPDEREADYFSKNLPAILGWYQTDNCQASDNSALCNIARAYNRLTASDFNSLSQSLGGFNEALLMHRQTMQLDVADPLAFDDYQPFAAAVKDAVRQNIISAPQPLDDFNPIRSGAFKLLRLRLVDTFGQVRDVDCEKVLTTEQLKVDGSPYEMTLPPRLTQPARINVRWLSASANDVEMNDHPATSPICGWVLPNNLDRSLMIYDGDGKALGSINQESVWESAPGDDDPISVAEIPNSHLRKLVGYLLDAENKFLADDTAKQNFLSDFLSALDNALENIEPENYAQHQDIALLMGSPLAVVRAAVNLELRGLPAVHQGWNVFRQDLSRSERDTDDFDSVEFPVRIGEYKQFNDGVVGYWKETAEEYENNVFYAPQSNEIENEFIKTHQNDPMTILQTLSGESQILTMLLDPRGSVHATSGILPVKSVSLPPDQYADALKAIEITFLSAPILTDFGKLRLLLPVEPGFQWSWLQKDKRAWSEITSPGIVRKQIFLDAFTDGEAVWGKLQNKGWIKPSADAETAVIVRRDDKNRQADLGSDFAALVPQIESLLDKAQIGAINPSAAFSDSQEILEGWLKLRNI